MGVLYQTRSGIVAVFIAWCMSNQVINNIKLLMAWRLFHFCNATGTGAATGFESKQKY